MGHRIRKARQDNSAILSGLAPIDETYIGGKEKINIKTKKPKASKVEALKPKPLL